MGQPTILWDFDGTLARRPGLWSGALVEVLDTEMPGHGITREELRSGLRDGFPWHEHQRGHEHLNSPEAWWAHVQRTLARALQGVGIDDVRSRTLAARVPDHYLDPGRWVVADDAKEALALAAGAGWQNVILSNHAPELATLVDALGLRTHVSHVLTSARHGFEKPHPRAYEVALTASGHPDTVWMVGDNPIADVAGAARVGIPGVLIRHGPMGPEAETHLDAQYAHSGWNDWREHCRHTAGRPLEAVELIRRETAGQAGTPIRSDDNIYGGPS